jgi:Lamin Tail Domain
VNDSGDPVEKQTAVDLLADPFRFDQEKLEGLALGGGSLFVVNDNDGGTAQNFFLRLSPYVLGAPVMPEVVPDVVINEVNSTGANPDSVELRNRGVTTADISGWTLTDGGGGVFTIPESTTILAGGVLLFDALSFGLGSADSVALATSLGTPVDSHAWTAHVSSASRCGTTAPIFWPTDGSNGAGVSTPGTANDCTGPTVAGQSDIVINEINSSGNDFVELYNQGVAEVDLSGWKVTDSDPTHVYILPAGTTIAAGAYLVIEGDWTTVEPALTFGLGQGDSVIVYTPYDQEVDNQTWTGHAATASRCPDGTGASFTNPTTVTKGTANACL